MSIKLFAAGCTLIILTGCTNIYFDNGMQSKVSNKTLKSSQWHHNFALALYEGSEPLDLTKHCPQGEWQSAWPAFIPIPSLGEPHAKPNCRNACHRG